jgi:hypothetical protein
MTIAIGKNHMKQKKQFRSECRIFGDTLHSTLFAEKRSNAFENAFAHG